MNIFERQVAKFERRIKQIEESPSRSLLESNKVLYEMSLDHWKDMIKWWEAGEPFAWHDGIVPAEILESMGIHTLSIEGLSYQVIRDAPRYVDIGQAGGLAVDVCSSIQAEWGIVLSEELPPPVLMVTMATVCDSIFKATALYAHHYKVPLYSIDCPYHNIGSDESMAYLVEQYKEFIRFAEDITGHKYNEDKLRQLQERGRALRPIQREIFELRKAVPCPMQGRDSIRGGGGRSGDPRTLPYLEKMRDEIKSRVERKVGAVPGEKLRIAWLHTAPLYTDTFGFLEKLGAPIVVSELGAAGTIRWEEDEGLAPLEQIAKQQGGHHWHGPIERKMRSLVEMCQEFKVDACIHFSQWGCRANQTSSTLVKGWLQKEMGIPTLILEGDYMDVRNFNRVEYEERLEQFVKMVLLTKGGAVREYDYDKEVYAASQLLDEEGMAALGCHEG